METMPETYLIRYTRHARSESNAEDNSGVHEADPPLTWPCVEEEWLKENPESGKVRLRRINIDENGEKIYMGRSYIEKYMRPIFEKYEKDGEQSTVFIVSPLARALQTFFITVPYKTLKECKIILEPLIIEQTRWFSDRARSIKDLKDLIEFELKERRDPEPLRLENLCIVWTKLLQRRDEDGNPISQAETEDTETLDKGWHLKEDLWHPDKLLERGAKAVQAIAEECRAADDMEGAKYVSYSVCVFGHGGFVNYMAEEVGDIDTRAETPKLTDWDTGETRSYKIVDCRLGEELDGILLVEPEDLRIARLKGKNKDPQNYTISEQDQRRRELRDWIVNMKYFENKATGKEDKALAELYARADCERRNPKAVFDSQKYLRNLQKGFMRKL